VTDQIALVKLDEIDLEKVIENEVAGMASSDKEEAVSVVFGEKQFYENEALKLSNEKLRLENLNLSQNISLRRTFGSWTFILVALWLYGTMELIFGVATNIAHLSDPVMIALITTSLATVVGLLWLVLAYLFPQGK
jgi:hypothetical protein